METPSPQAHPCPQTSPNCRQGHWPNPPSPALFSATTAGHQLRRSSITLKIPPDSQELKWTKKAMLKLPKATFHEAISSSLRRRRKGKNSMVLTSSCYKLIYSQALPVVFLSYFVFGSFVCRECVWPVGP
uniref:Uncharacterized protein n=1 Tax=Oryza glaberrima TaxID=4538 RepID=I1QZ47_ORYGL